MSEIKTYEDACENLKLNPLALPDVSMLPEKHRLSFIAFIKLTIIIEAINNGWTPNWADAYQKKYYNYFWVDASGFGFSGSYAGYDNACTDIGSRLYFAKYEDAEYARKQFAELYKEYYLMPKL